MFVPDSYRADVLGHQGNPAALILNLDAVFAEVGAREHEEGFSNKEVLNLSPDNCYARQRKATAPYHQAGSHAQDSRQI